VTAPSTDLVVVLPGIMGSTLRQHGQLIWAPSRGAVLRAISSFGNSVKRLQLPAGIGDDHPGDGVEPAGLMPDLHLLPGIWTPLKGYDRLMERLRSMGYREPTPDMPGNLLPVPYDWRLSSRYNGQRLTSIVEPALERWRSQGGRYADARIVFVCHSMGGLVARWYIEQRGGAEVTRKLITLGTPYRGAARALEQLVNGVHKALGSLGVDLTGFARSLPSLHQLLPEYACITAPDGLAKTTEVLLPELSTEMVSDAMRFHLALREAEGSRPESLASIHAIVGTRQATATTARLAHGLVELLGTFDGQDLQGDGTVPIVGASRADVPLDSNTLRRVPDKHGSLQRNQAALDEVEGILTARPVIVRNTGKPVSLSVTVPELALRGERVTVAITPGEAVRHSIRLCVTSEAGKLIESRVLRSALGTITTTLDGLPPGAHAIDVSGTSPASPYQPVSSDILVW
jgi:pimeloyl-ACP methyl ester carboxylesterase